MTEAINTALEAIVIISYLSGITPVETNYYELLVAFLSISKFISKYVLKCERNYTFLNQHIYYSQKKMVLIK